MVNPTHLLIEELLVVLRSQGIVSYKGPFGGLGSIEVVLGDLPPEQKSSLPLQKDKEPEKVGADGLTAAEQMDFYGTMMDTE